MFDAITKRKYFSPIGLVTPTVHAYKKKKLFLLFSTFHEPSISLYVTETSIHVMSTSSSSNIFLFYRSTKVLYKA